MGTEIKNNIAKSVSNIQLNYEPPADPVFKDKNKCVHTYVSPRVAYDLGLEHPLECPKEAKGEEQSAHKGGKKENEGEKKGAADAKAKDAPAAPEADAKKAAPEAKAAV